MQGGKENLRRGGSAKLAAGFAVCLAEAVVRDCHMKRMAGLILAAMCLAGCGVVTTDSPVASTTSRTLQEQLRGVWRGEDTVVQVEFDSAGRGVFASLEWDGDRFARKTGELFARERGNWNYFSARALDEGEKKEAYVLGAFRRLDSGELVVWPADAEAFRRFVEEGKIEGEVSTKHVTSVRVTDGPKLLELIDEPRAFFRLEEPLVLQPVFPARESAEAEASPDPPQAAHSHP